MKKLLLACGLFCFLLTGCTKNYESMDSYIKDMKANKAKYNVFFFEANQETVEGNLYSRNIFEGEKFRTDYSDDAGYTYKSSIWYDGKDVYEHVEGEETALVTNDVDAKTALNMSKFHPVLNWWEDIELGKVKAKFSNANYFTSTLDCRLIELSDEREVCVHDKYGIAVYYKQEPIAQDVRRKGEIIDVLNIDANTQMPPNILSLPEHIKEVQKNKETK